MKDKDLMTQDKAVTSPAEMIKLAVEGKADLEKLEKLLILQERFEANQAKKEYVKAISLFKANAPTVIKDKLNKQYNSKYTSLGNLVNTVNPELSKYGLSASWDIEQNGIIKVTCKMTHELGHSETASMSAPADTSGAKNVIQQIKSTITYLKAVTFESITGLASTDANLDDDGTAGATTFIDDKQKNQILDLIADTGADIPKFLTYMKVESLDVIPADQYQKAITALNNKKKAVAK